MDDSLPTAGQCTKDFNSIGFPTMVVPSLTKILPAEKENSCKQRVATPKTPFTPTQAQTGRSATLVGPTTPSAAASPRPPASPLLRQHLQQLQLSGGKRRMLQSGPIRFFPAHQSSPSNTASSSPALTPMPTSRSDTPCSNTSFQSTSSSGLPVSGEVVRISTRKECLNPMAFTLLHNNEFDDYKFAKGDVVQEEDLRFLDLVDTSTYFYSRSAASSREASPSTIPVTVSSDPPSLPNVSRPHPIRPLSQLPLPPPPRICHNAYSRKLQL